MTNPGLPRKAQSVVPFLNGTDGSKFIVRPIAATLIRDGVAMGLQFIKNHRLIVQERDPQPGLVPESRGFYNRNTFV